MRHKTLLALALAGASLATHAAEVYVGAGFPGLLLGVAQPVSPGVTLRADVMGLGSDDASGTEEGITYDGRGKLQRTGLFADWFPFAGRFRVTGGVTVNDVRIDLTARSTTGTIVIGGTTYPITGADRMDVTVKFPRTTPYVGIGGGHQAAAAGFGFAWDIGVSIGRATVEARTSGPNLSQVSQSDLDRELAELRDGVGKIRVLPQVSAALSYRF